MAPARACQLPLTVGVFVGGSEKSEAARVERDGGAVCVCVWGEELCALPLPALVAKASLLRVGRDMLQQPTSVARVFLDTFSACVYTRGIITRKCLGGSADSIHSHILDQPGAPGWLSRFEYTSFLTTHMGGRRCVQRRCICIVCRVGRGRVLPIKGQAKISSVGIESDSPLISQADN